ncbi:hypothetical protein CPC08DRAFT_711903 [Agrocybe pediades]|nr:hypothetical protein CPC08DRAFT_711903 [Agrocybe pediades]
MSIDTNYSYYLRSKRYNQYLGSSGEEVYPYSKKAGRSTFLWIFVPQGGGQYHLQSVSSERFICAATDVRIRDNYRDIPVITRNPSWEQYRLSVTIEGENVYFVPYIHLSDKKEYTMRDNAVVLYLLESQSVVNSKLGKRETWYYEKANLLQVDSPVPLLPPITNPTDAMVVKNPLPKGVYRIRALSGGYVLTMPKGAVPKDGKLIPFVAKQVPGDLYQRWTVTPQPGKTPNYVTIANVGNNLYLAGNQSNLVDGTPVFGQPSAFSWDLATSGSGVLFFIGVRDAGVSFGFADYEAHESEQVQLKTSDNVLSQIWLFETFKRLDAAVYHNNRVIAPGWYFIEIQEMNTFISVTAEDELQAALSRDTATKFSISYPDENDPKFTISYVMDGVKSYITVTKDHLETTGERKHATEWIAIPPEHNDGGTVYRIVDANSHGPRKAMSSRMITDRKRSFFAVDPLAEQEVMQMFRFFETAAP